MDNKVKPMIKFGEWIKDEHKQKKSLADILIFMAGDSGRATNFAHYLLMQKYDDNLEKLQDICKGMTTKQIQMAIDCMMIAMKLEA